MSTEGANLEVKDAPMDWSTKLTEFTAHLCAARQESAIIMRAILEIQDENKKLRESNEKLHESLKAIKDSLGLEDKASVIVSEKTLSDVSATRKRKHSPEDTPVRGPILMTTSTRGRPSRRSPSPRDRHRNRSPICQRSSPVRGRPSERRRSRSPSDRRRDRSRSASRSRGEVKMQPEEEGATCMFCSKEHPSHKCDRWASYSDRKDFIYRLHGKFCPMCLQSVEKCDKKKCAQEKCGVCSNPRHNSILCSKVC